MSTQQSRVYNGRYEIVRHIARGGMAEVYQAKDQLLDRNVALKVLFAELSVDPSFVARFRREAQAAANLSNQSIVAIYDWGEEDGTYFIVMEYVEGRPLSQLLRSEGRLTANKAAQIAAGTAAALSYAHRHGVIHRDVKPGNILLDNNGGIKVTDFGIARAGDTTENLTQTGIVMGTATYFSPEQAQGLDTDGRTDVYSLGVVLYEMVTGRPPFTGDTPVSIAYKQVKEEPEPPRKVEPSVPADFEAIILTAMEKDREKRYPSADELRADLIRFGRGQTPKAVRIRNALAGITPAAAATVAAPPSVDATTVLPVATADATTAMSTSPPAVTGALAGTEEEKDRTAVWAVSSLVLILVLVLLGFAFWRLIGGTGGGGAAAEPSVAVAGVVGKPLSEATVALDQQGFAVTTQDGNDPSKPGGIVLSQDPAAGASVAKGSTVKLVVNTATNKVEVPRVISLPQADATKAITDAGLVAQVVFQKNPAVSAGLVFVQTPDPKTQADKGSTVTITVSTGEGLAPIPDVTGLPQDEAVRRLGEAGYSTKLKQENNPTVPAGNVIRTDPAAGVTPPKGATSVTVYVSLGATTTTLGKVTVPNVINMTEQAARSTLESAGFVVQVNQSTGGIPGRVKAQSPGGGTKAMQGSTVVITVSSAPTTTTTAGSTSTSGSSTTTTSTTTIL
jgi:serine/threonine-protein kinase